MQSLPRCIRVFQVTVVVGARHRPNVCAADNRSACVARRLPVFDCSFPIAIRGMGIVLHCLQICGDGDSGGVLEAVTIQCEWVGVGGCRGAHRSLCAPGQGIRVAVAVRI
jgi:hypothetical protein